MLKATRLSQGDPWLSVPNLILGQAFSLTLIIVVDTLF